MKGAHALTEQHIDLRDESDVVHMTRRTRICIWIIVLGLANFLAYVVVYVSIGGEAVNGDVRAMKLADGATRLCYYVSNRGREAEVGRGVWVYSAVHSISVWITMGAVMLAMLTLAKDRIVSSMRSSIVRGRTFITILATIVTLISVAFTVYFTLGVINMLADAKSDLSSLSVVP